MKQTNSDPTFETFEAEQRRLFNERFDGQFFENLSKIMGYKDVQSEERLGDCIFFVVEAYKYGKLRLENFKSEKQENEALAKVSKTADQLYDAIMGLRQFGQTEKKLSSAIKNYPNLYNIKNGTTFADLLDHESNPFFSLRELLVDLQICAETAVNKMPKPQLIEASEGLEELRLDSDEELAEDTTHWRNRSSSHRLHKDHALQCFINEFRECWLKFSAYPFTEGMYFHEINATISPTVDAMGLIFSKNSTRRLPGKIL
ncbi:MAG: hypothetical protein GXP05_06430 [Alphaproteobacteria bacterium]|nr:hypothetical protein [Alphaproteobacteria bacterium]